MAIGPKAIRGAPGQTVTGVKAKVDNGGKIIDAAVRPRIAETLLALNEAAAEQRAWLED